MDTSKSKTAFDEAKKYIPGGVNSLVRAFKNVGTYPLFIERANGSKIYDIDGNEYIDYVGSWGPMFLGHCKEIVLEAVKEACDKGMSFGAPCLAETELAKRICSLVPCVDVVRMVNSGTEATMSAIRLARGYTGRNIIIKFEGCYHGHSDSLLIKAGSGAATFGSASSAGVPEDFAKYTLVLPYNDIDAIEDAFEKMGSKIAGVIIEPVAGNMGVVPPKDGYLQKIREITKKYGSVFIVDEVMTGFRLSASGAIGRFGLEKLSAAVCLSAHTAVNVRLWNLFRRQVLFIRQVHCRVIHLQWRRVTHRLNICRKTPIYMKKLNKRVHILRVNLKSRLKNMV